MVVYRHKHCGLVDTKTHTCTKCHKHWNIFTWWLNTEIRAEYIVEKRQGNMVQRTTVGYRTHAGWGDKFPGVGKFASKLPNWPRWARILVTLGTLAVIILVVWWVRK